MQSKSDTHAAFSDRIEQLRLKHGDSMVAVAKALDVSRTMLYDIKNGRVPVSPKMWRKLELAESNAAQLSLTSRSAMLQARIKEAEIRVKETNDLLSDFQGVARLNLQMDFITRQIEWLEASLAFSRSQLEELKAQAIEAKADNFVAEIDAEVAASKKPSSGLLGARRKSA